MSALSGADAALDGPLDDRIRRAALACVSRKGVRKTTLDDVAGEAGCSRASIYRVFPGGKDVVLAAVLEGEVERLLADLAVRLADARSLEDTLVVAITGATRAVTGHPALQRLLAHEPQVVLPHLSFEGLDAVLARAVEFLAPWLARFTDAPTAREVAEWATRVACLYAEPSASFDLTQPHSTRRLVTTYLLAAGAPVATSSNTPQESTQ
jgi:AcrR family transcriptional regulator